jgi:hypothetical protein
MYYSGAFMTKQDEQDARIDAILGAAQELTLEDARDKFYDHLRENLELPCVVAGIEDFNWEEFYVFGPGSREEYERLRRTQPSYRDKFDLLEIEKDVISEWMLFRGEDLAAHVRRQSDGREFYPGLAELKAIDKKSRNHQLLDDYSVWFANSR